MRLDGKTALVTGAERGLGQIIAVALAKAGAHLLLTSKGDPQATRMLIEELGGEAASRQLDVSVEREVVELFDECVPTFGSIDILVNNAGVSLEKPLLETSTEEFDGLMNVNLRGSFMIGRETIRHMVGHGRGGRIINVSSDLGYLGREEFSVYCASKAGILGLTKSWAREFAPQILVNAICPGPMETDMLGIEQMSEEWRKKEEDNPMGRVGDPQEIAGVAVFLAGPDSTFVTGQGIGVNGGSYMP